MLSFPTSTVFERRIPKQKFYQNLDVTAEVKRLFIEQIKLITWANKLSAQTMNLAPGQTVQEIEVFRIEKFLREQKPELLHHQKFLENGTAERAKESGTEQNYNMIDGCVNNNPKKPRIIGNRISVLDRLHIKLEERKQKSQPQQQQERSRKN